MTNTAILSCLAVASKGSSLKSMFEQVTAHEQTLSYDSLTRFFSRPWSAENELQEAAQNLFQLRKGWAILDEIVIAKSIKSTLLASVKRRRKSAGGYVTPAISVVLLLRSDDSAFHWLLSVKMALKAFRNSDYGCSDFSYHPLFEPVE